MSFYIISLTFVFCVNLCSCDLPVHCKMEEIYSLWTFRIDSASFEPSLKNEQTTCGHGFPDQVDTTIGDKNFKFKHYNDIELILGKDYKVYDKTGMIQEGNWTTVYDEAFVVYYKQMVFTAFMKYYKNSHRDKDYSSNCDKTMVGWVIENGKEINKNWHCFFGFKSSIKNQFSPNTFLGYNNYNTNSNTEKGYAFLEMELGAISEANMKMTDYSQKDFVDEINKNTDLLWKADIYDDYKNLSFFELRKKLGLNNKNKKISSLVSSIPSEYTKLLLGHSPINQPTSFDSFLEQNAKTSQYKIAHPDRDGNLETNYSVISKYLNTEISDIDENTLPKNWD